MNCTVCELLLKKKIIKEVREELGEQSFLEKSFWVAFGVSVDLRLWKGVFMATGQPFRTWDSFTWLDLIIQSTSQRNDASRGDPCCEESQAR